MLVGPLTTSPPCQPGQTLPFQKIRVFCGQAFSQFLTRHHLCREPLNTSAIKATPFNTHPLKIPPKKGEQPIHCTVKMLIIKNALNAFTFNTQQSSTMYRTVSQIRPIYVQVNQV